MPRKGAKGLPPAKRMQLMGMFREYDTSGDNKMDRNELKFLLQKGNPDIADVEVSTLFAQIDKNNDGSIDFDEFVDFIFDMQTPMAPLPLEVAQRFVELFPDDVDLDAFLKLCSDCKLIGGRLRKADAEELFAKVRPRGKKGIDVEGFEKLLCFLAERKGVQPTEVMEQIQKSRKFMASSGPGAGAADRGGEDAECRGDARTADAPSDSVAPWEPLRPIFHKFCRSNTVLDRTEFSKLCMDCWLLDDRLKKADVDVIYTSLMKASRRMEFEEFQSAIIMVAAKKGVPTKEVQAKVAGCSGPKSTVATHSDGPRLNASMQGSRGQTAPADVDLGDENHWSWVKKSFEAYADRTGHLSESQFRNLCEDCELLSKDFMKRDAEILFSSLKEKTISFERFQEVLRQVAVRKNCAISELQWAVGMSAGKRKSSRA